MVIPNGHEYSARQAQQTGVETKQTSNCFSTIINICLHFALPEEERVRSGFVYDHSLFQVEFSRNLLFRRPAQMVLKPVLAGAGEPKGGRKPENQTDLDIQYAKVQTEMHHLLGLPGIVIEPYIDNFLWMWLLQEI